MSNMFIAMTSSTSMSIHDTKQTVMAMPVSGGLLSLELYDRTTGSQVMPTPTEQLQSRIEQAVFYGDRSDVG
jgi:hypothetical protein